MGKKGRGKKSLNKKTEDKTTDYLRKSEDNAEKRFIKQGLVSEASSNLSSSFIVPFAQGIGANTAHIGFISAFSGLVAPVGDLWGSKLMEKSSRKKIYLKYTTWQALIWLPIILLTYMYLKGIGTEYLPYALIVFYSLFIFFSAVKEPASFSWMGDIVPQEERGKYFALRNKVIGWVGIIIFLAGGIFLYYFEHKSYILAAYSGIFLLAIVLRLYSAYQVRHIFSPKFKLNKDYYFSFWSFIKRYDNFGKFSVFQAVFNFAIMVASPFFAVYMLNDLHFNLFTFTVVSVSSSVFYLLLVPLAGKFSDRYGNLKLLYIAAFAFPITPVLWLFLKNPLWLILLPGFTAGLGNAAFSIGSTNFTYDAVSPQKRGICLAYSAVLSGIGIFLGSVFGGLLIQYLHVSFMNTTLFVFALAAVLRFGVLIFFLPGLKDEYGKNPKIKGLSVDVLHPMRTVHGDLVWFKKFLSTKD